MNAWLADRSALIRLGDSLDAELWAQRIQDGLVRTCSVTKLEIGAKARSGNQLRRAFHSAPLAVMPVESLSPAIEARAVEVQLLLADASPHGQLRTPTVSSLLIAAAGELGGLTVLHVNDDFDLISSVTVQSIERPRMPESMLIRSTPLPRRQPVR